MAIKQNTQIQTSYALRREKLVEYMRKNSITVALFEDGEEKRDPSIRYFTGHPSDALFLMFNDGKNVLIPWDENLAKQMAFADKIIPYTKYGRNRTKTISSILNLVELKGKETFELPDTTSYPDFLNMVDTLPGWDVRCRTQSLHQFAQQLRSVKDDFEITCTMEAARITDVIIDLIEAKARSGEIKTESDVALLIEKECRKMGCEKTGFDTLAAGPERSFAIHCFPNYTDGAWPAEGLSILDFGVVFNGYTSDVTLTIAKGNLSDAQEKQLQLVQKAYDECLKLYEKDVPICSASAKADEIFAKAKRKMPHSLGHGIGLEIHEEPFVRVASPSENVFKPGMIVTLEPGLYDPLIGGTRLENDILITETGNTPLTHSRIIRM